jgi:hypothetical protein
MLPVSEVQAAAVEVVLFPLETVVVVYWHIQVTLVSVAPLTVALSTSD